MKKLSPKGLAKKLAEYIRDVDGVKGVLDISVSIDLTDKGGTLVLSWVDASYKGFHYSFYYKGNFVLEKLNPKVFIIRPVCGCPDCFYQNVLEDRYVLKGEFGFNYREVFRV